MLLREKGTELGSDEWKQQNVQGNSNIMIR